MGDAPREPQLCQRRPGLKSTFDAHLGASSTGPLSSPPAPSGVLPAARARQRRKAHAHLTDHSSPHPKEAGEPRGSLQAGEEGTRPEVARLQTQVASSCPHPHPRCHHSRCPHLSRALFSSHLIQAATSTVSHLCSCDSLQARPSDLPSAQSDLPQTQILYPSPATSLLPT